MSEISHHSTSEVKKAERQDVFKLPSNNIEIDLIEKAKHIWAGRGTILIFIFVCAGIAYFHSSFGPTEYTSTSSLIQESEGASVGDFGSSFLSSLTGLNISSNNSANMSAVATGRAPLPVTLYPRIVASTDFQKELIYTELEFSTLDSTLTLFDYFHDYKEPAFRDKVYTLAGNMTIYLPLTVLQWTKSFLSGAKDAIFSLWRDETIANPEDTEVQIVEDDRLQSVSSEEKAVMDWLILKINLASSDGVMEITTNLPDPKAAALVNAKLVEYIQEYIKDYRIKKAQQNLEDTLERYKLAKERYEEAQFELAEYQDENINISSNRASIEEERLRNEANLRYNIYNSVAQEVEQARMVLQQQVPVFNPLEKPNVPQAPSTGTSPLLLVFAGLLGLFGGIGWVIIRNLSFFK